MRHWYVRPRSHRVLSHQFWLNLPLTKNWIQLKKRNFCKVLRANSFFSKSVQTARVFGFPMLTRDQIFVPLLNDVKLLLCPWNLTGVRLAAVAVTAIQSCGHTHKKRETCPQATQHCVPSLFIASLLSCVLSRTWWNQSWMKGHRKHFLSATYTPSVSPLLRPK